MSNTSELLASLTAAGLSVRVVNGNQLAIEPAAQLTHDLRQYIRLHKSELLALLAANDPHPPVPIQQSGVIQYRLRSGGGGILIDPDGIASAVETLWQQYGERIDMDALVDGLAEQQAEALGVAEYE